MFFKLKYDDSDPEKIKSFIRAINAESNSPFKNRYVKIIVVNKNDPHLYDSFMDTIQRVGEPFELTTAEDFSAPDIDDYVAGEEEKDNLEYGMDTMTVLNKYVDNLSSNNSLPQNIEPIRTKNVLRELYVEAVNLESASSTSQSSDDT
jgi:hypothetical protein